MARGTTVPQLTCGEPAASWPRCGPGVPSCRLANSLVSSSIVRILPPGQHRAAPADTDRPTVWRHLSRGFSLLSFIVFLFLLYSCALPSVLCFFLNCPFLSFFFYYHLVQGVARGRTARPVQQDGGSEDSEEASHMHSYDIII